MLKGFLFPVLHMHIQLLQHRLLKRPPYTTELILQLCKKSVGSIGIGVFQGSLLHASWGGKQMTNNSSFVKTQITLLLEEFS